MKKFIFCLLIFAIVSCKKSENVTGESALKNTAAWSLNRMTEPGTNQTISSSRLGASAVALFGMDIQFRENNITRALDRTTKQVLNGGTWYLKDNNAVLDVDVQGFKGLFAVVELSKSKFVIRQENVPIDGKNQAAQLEFVPSK